MRASDTHEGDMRGGFFGAYDERGCEYVPLAEPGDRQAAEERPGAGLGQLRDPLPARLPDHGARAGASRTETIDFMRKLDVKEIHGYDAAQGLKLVRPDALAKRAAGGQASRLRPQAQDGRMRGR